MSESIATLSAALIGAIAALLVGGVAFMTALKQVTKTAYTQRQQAFWQMRRDSYAGFLLAYSDFLTAVGACHRCISSDVSIGDSDMRNLLEATGKIEHMAAVLELEAPSEAGILEQVATLRGCVFLMHRYIREWREGENRVLTDRAEDLALFEQRYVRLGGEMMGHVRELRRLFRLDLHKDAES